MDITNNKTLYFLYRYRYLLLASFVCILIALIASQYSFIVITQTGSTQDKVSYILKRDTSEKTFESSSGSIRRLVRKGDYQVSAFRGDFTGFGATKANGFLTTTTIELNLVSEKDRSFIGDKPKSCLYSAEGSQLFSWQCGEKLNESQYHKPPQNKTPGYNLQLLRYPGRFLGQDIVLSNGRSYVFSRLDDIDLVRHVLFALDTTTNLINENDYIELTDLDYKKDYRSVKYKEGYLVFSTNGDDFIYYKNFQSPPEKINIAKTTIPELSLYAVQTSNDSIVLVNNKHYNTEFDGYMYLNPSTFAISSKYYEEEDVGQRIENSNQPVEYSEVVIYNNGKETRYKLDVVAGQARLCSENLLCVLADGNMIVYEIRGNKAVKQHSIANVKQIEDAQDGVYLVNNLGLVKYDTKNKTGNYLFTFSDYIYCGLDTIETKKDPLLCIEKDGSKEIVYINPDSNQTDKIDKKISELRKTEGVRSVSIHGRTIHITPIIQESVFSSELSSYIFDPVRVKEVNARIMEQVKQLGIPENYQVIFTID